MGNSLFDDMMVGAVVAKHLFRGASKAVAKAKQVADSEKGQQLKAELLAKTNEAIELAGDKAKEMGLEAKAKHVLDFAKEMILNDSFEMTPDVQVIVYGPGGYVERIEALEQQIRDENERHNKVMAELSEALANAPESIDLSELSSLEDIPDTANIFEDEIRKEEEIHESNIYNLQEELKSLREELDEGLFMERQRQREGDAYEKDREREENERDWAIFLGQDPDKRW